MLKWPPQARALNPVQHLYDGPGDSRQGCAANKPAAANAVVPVRPNIVQERFLHLVESVLQATEGPTQ